MANHIEKTSQAVLIHHPSDALDRFGRYDESSRAWSQFNVEISQQIADFEDSHPQFRRPHLALDRRSNWNDQPR